jgi:phage host-nuclease inhibitor protein Gam
VKDRAQANQVLAEIGQLKRQVAAINAALNDDIDRAKAEAEQKIAPLASRLDALENGLLAFAEYNKDELFPKQRSLDLVYGVIGYRRSKELGTMPKTTWKQVLGKLKELGLAAGIRTKEDWTRSTCGRGPKSAWPWWAAATSKRTASGTR